MLPRNASPTTSATRPMWAGATRDAPTSSGASLSAAGTQPATTRAAPAARALLASLPTAAWLGVFTVHELMTHACAVSASASGTRLRGVGERVWEGGVGGGKGGKR